MSLETLLFGDYSKKQIKKIKKKADAVDALSGKYAGMEEAELRGITEELRRRLSGGETLDDILPDAFAAVRETADRILGKRPFYVQILGAILLHQGRIAEMKTGEGKTLVATLPAYLNALSGKGVHIVTVNDYLALRDAQEMGRIFEYLGLQTGVILKTMTPDVKREQYKADITYGTNTEFGFDYLRDNIAKSKNELLQRGHNFCIIDEVDSILIDEARTPLIISGMSNKSADELYTKCDTVVRTMTKKVIKELDTKAETDDINFDYIVDEKKNSTVLTPRGAEKVEKYFGINNINDPENASISHGINQAIHAYGVKKRDVDYVISNGEVIIVDPFTGRLMHGRRYQDGLHQAIEAKEHLNVRSEMRVSATVTIQNYFRMYSKLSGMTGTALTEEEEFREIYGLDVVEVPTNKPMIRIDHPDRVFTDEKSKYKAIIKQVIECHENGQPVLVGTASVEKSEIISKLLKEKKIPHNVLNAKNNESEADIIADAGKPGKVTIATNMAGRGTDIMLGGNPEYEAKKEMTRLGIRPGLIASSTGTAPTEDFDIRNARNTFKNYFLKFSEQISKDKESAIAAGGLYIIGSERHESRRIDNQLRGRSGRQGDPGESTFFISLQDDIMRLFGDERMKRFAAMSTNWLSGEDGDLSQNTAILSDVMEKAQKRVEAENFKHRKSVIQFDDILNEQRKQIYAQRNEILMEGDLSEKIKSMIVSTIDEFTHEVAGDKNTAYDVDAVYHMYGGWLCKEGELEFARDKTGDKITDEVAELLTDNALTLYGKRADDVGDERFRSFERSLLLDNIDDLWLDHIEGMDNLKQSVTLQSYAQRDPLTEYKLTGSNMYADLINEIRDKTVREVLTKTIPEVIVITPSMLKNLQMSRTPGARRKVIQNIIDGRTKQKPNEPCACGSGKKYKKCCGATQSGEVKS